METWILGAIMMIVGFLVIGCSVAHNELGIPFTATGLTAAGVGTWICLIDFKKWIANI